MKNEEDNNAQLPEQQENSRVQKKGRRCRIVLFVLLLFFVISVGTLTVLAAMIFSEPKQTPVRPLTEKEYQVQQKITRHLGKDLFRKRPKLISQIVFTPEEMTSLLNLTDSCLTAVKLAGKYRGINLRDFEPVFRKGELSIVYPIDTGRRWLFGGVIRLQMTGTPCFAEKKLQIELKECHLGRLFLPSEKVQEVLDQLLFEIQKSKGFVRFSDVVKEIKANPDGSWTVTYYPLQLSMCLKNLLFRRGKL